MVKGYLICCNSSHVKPTWEIWRQCVETSSVKRNHQLSSTSNIGVKDSVQSWGWKLFTAGSIISSLSTPSNYQVSEYTYYCYYIPLFNCIVVMVVLCILWLYCFNGDTMLLTFICNFNASYVYNIYIYHDRWSRQDSSTLCLYMGRHIFWIQVTQPVQIMLPHCWQVKWSVIIKIQWQQDEKRQR